MRRGRRRVQGSSAHTGSGLVLVTGTLEQFRARRATRQYGGTFDADLFQPFLGKPAVSAVRIERVS